VVEQSSDPAASFPSQARRLSPLARNHTNTPESTLLPVERSIAPRQLPRSFPEDCAPFPSIRMRHFPSSVVRLSQVIPSSRELAAEQPTRSRSGAWHFQLRPEVYDPAGRRRQNEPLTNIPTAASATQKGKLRPTPSKKYIPM
jgi:hypothetical protein